MPTEKQHYVAVMPDKSEHPFELNVDERGRGGDNFDITSRLNQIVGVSGITTPRATPSRIHVHVFRLLIEGAQLVRHPAGIFQIMPPCARLTEEQFKAEQNQILLAVPREFHPNLITAAWDRGHASGLEEVIIVLKSYVEMIADPLLLYRNRVESDYAQLKAKH